MSYLLLIHVLLLSKHNHNKKTVANRYSTVANRYCG